MGSNYVCKIKQYILLSLDRDVVDMQTAANDSGPSMNICHWHDYYIKYLDYQQ